MRRRKVIAWLLAGATATGIAACNPLAAFNALIPKDGKVVKAVTDRPFGPDPRQKLDIYRPSNGSKRMPVIVFFYGGSWNSGSKAGYSWVARALAARGFVVAVPDYRLVPKGRFPAFVEDGAAAVVLAARLAQSVGGDPDRIIVAGHSAGAYIAAMLAYDERWLGRDRNRIKGFMGLAGPYDFLPLSGPAIRAAFDGARDLAATQPVNFVAAGDPPAFIATADEDRTVHWRNSDSLTAKLRASRVEVVRKRYPGVGHAGLVTALARPFRGRARVLDDMAAFANDVAATRL